MMARIIFTIIIVAFSSSSVSSHLKATGGARQENPASYPSGVRIALSERFAKTPGSDRPVCLKGRMSREAVPGPVPLRESAPLCHSSTLQF